MHAPYVLLVFQSNLFKGKYLPELATSSYSSTDQLEMHFVVFQTIFNQIVMIYARDHAKMWIYLPVLETVTKP